MAGDLTQVIQKLRWAELQWANLNFTVSQYVESGPYVTRIEDKPELEGYSAFAQLRSPPPPEVALRAGDFLNSIHGVLDYLAWQLVLRENKIPDRPTSFPILLPNQDGSHPTVNIRDESNSPAIADQQVLDALDAGQPYKDGDAARNHPLYVLAVLNRETKHRHLPLLVTSVPGFEVGGGFTDIPDQLPVFDEKRLQSGDEVEVFTPYPENRHVPEQIKLHALVALEQIGYAPDAGLMDVLGRIHHRVVTDVLPRFAPLF